MATRGPKYSESYLEGMLECSICLDPVHDPYTLQRCLHSVCKACMDKLRAEQNNDPPGVNCPVCRKFSEEDMIMGNFFIKELVEVQKSVKEQKRPICQPCADEGQSVDATCRCLDCKDKLCDACKKAHKKYKFMKGHTIVDLTDDSELVVDQVVFCRVHKDEPIKLYCELCNTLMCITCKVTKHNTHESQTIDEALQHLVPEIEKSTEFIDENIAAIAKSLDVVKMKITETKECYDNCYKDVDKTADARKQQIEETRVKIKQDLQVKEKEEVRKLESVKLNIEMKQRERENLKKVVRMSLDRARHVTLLSEFIQGGLQSKIREMIDQPEAHVKIQVNQPQLNTNDEEWEKIKQQGVLGDVVYNVISLLVAVTAFVTDVGGSRFASRYWNVNFTEYFTKKFKKVLEIKAGGSCFKIRFFMQKMWAPTGNAVKVYNKIGNIEKTIDIKNPRSVDQVDNGDIFIACHSNSGLYVMDDSDTPRKICNGSFADVYVYRDKVFALECEKKLLMEFCCKLDTTDVMQRWRSEKDWRVDEAGGNDRLIVTGDEDLRMYVSHWNSNKVSLYNTQGQCIKQFDSRQELGEGNIHYPWLCGVDRQSNLLVADHLNNMYKILDPGTSQWRSTGVKGERYVYDATLDDEGNLWLSQHNGNDCIIPKHEPQ